jgi:hypothetical protein
MNADLFNDPLNILRSAFEEELNIELKKASHEYVYFEVQEDSFGVFLRINNIYMYVDLSYAEKEKIDLKQVQKIISERIQGFLNPELFFCIANHNDQIIKINKSALIVTTESNLGPINIYLALSK